MARQDIQVPAKLRRNLERKQLREVGLRVVPLILTHFDQTEGRRIRQSTSDLDRNRMGVVFVQHRVVERRIAHVYGLVYLDPGRGPLEFLTAQGPQIGRMSWGERVCK